MISIKASCIDSTNEPAVVFDNEIQRLKDEGLKPEEQLTLEPYERDHAVVCGTYRAKKWYIYINSFSLIPCINYFRIHFQIYQ